MFFALKQEINHQNLGSDRLIYFSGNTQNGY